MLNHPDKIPQGTVSRYKTSFLQNEAFERQYKMDKTILKGNGYIFEEREIDGYTFLIVEGNSEYEMALEALEG